MQMVDIDVIWVMKIRKNKLMYIFLPISKKKENKISIIPLILAESINLCYGLSKNGYDKIDDVI